MAKIFEEERLGAWCDGASVQVVAVSANGDPVDMSVAEARAFLIELQKAIDEAEGD
jgi:hypothetical protein